MYYLVIEVAGYKQLKRLRPDITNRITNEMYAGLESRGAEVFAEEDGRFYVSFRNSGSHSVGRIIDASYSAFTTVRDYTDELHGFCMVLELLLGADSVEARARLETLLNRAPVGNHFWIGPNAATTLSPFLELQRHLDMWQVIGHRENTALLPAMSEFARQPSVVEPMAAQIRAALDDAETDRQSSAEPNAGPLVVLLYGAEGSGLPFLATAVAHELFGAQVADSPSIHGRIDSVDPWLPVVALSQHPHYGEVEKYLDRDERWVWDNVSRSLNGAYSSVSAGYQPDSFSHELREALILFLTTYVRRLAESGGTAILLLHRLEHLDARLNDVLHEACEAAAHVGRLLVIVTSEKPYVLPEFRRFPYVKVAARALDPAAIAGFLGNLPPDLHRDASSRVRTLTRGRVLHLYHYLWTIDRLGSRLERAHQRDKTIVEIVTDVLSGLEREALYVCSLSSGLLEAEELSRILVDSGVSPAAGREIWNGLYASGFIADERFPVPVYSDIAPLLSASIGDRSRALKARFDDEIHRQYIMCERELSPDRYRVLARHREPRIRVEAFSGFADTLLARCDVELIDELLSAGIDLPKTDGTPDQRNLLDHAIYLLRLARVRDFQFGDSAQMWKREASAVYSADPPPVNRSDGVQCQGRAALERARYCLAANSLKDASRLARRAVVLFQESGDASLVAEAQIEFGVVQLSEGRASEAREYLSMARSGGSESMTKLHRVRSLLYEAVADFLFGNYSLTFERCSEASAVARKAGIRAWQLFSLLLEGRTGMELGRYEQAAECFSTAIRQSRLWKIVAAEPVFRNWYARSLCHFGEPGRAIAVMGDVPGGKEHALFLAEAYERQGDFSRAFSVLDSSWPGRQSELQTTMRPCWDNGFATVEELAHGRGDSVIDQLYNSFRGHLLGKLGRTDEAIDTLRRQTRQTRPSDLDPQAPLYYFWYAGVLPAGRDEQFDDRVTEIGRSVKIVQQRVARIEQHTDKIDYRSRNMWFNRLFDEARHYNLV